MVRPGQVSRRHCPALLLCLLLFPLRSQALPSDHIQKSLELVGHGDLNGAEKEASLALENPATQPLGWVILGTIRLKQGKYDESAGFLNKALRANPRLLGARINLGSVYVLQGKPDRARAMFRSALQIDGSNYNARLDLAKLEASSGNYSTSLDVAQPVIPKLRRSDEGLLVLATDYLGIHREEAAQAVVSDWKALTYASQDSTLKIATLFRKSGLVQSAIEILEKDRSSRSSFDLALTLADCYFLKGDLKQASEHYESALDLKASCVPCLRRIAEIARRQGDSDKALAYLIRAKRLEPDNAEVLFEFGKVCLERDLVEDALPLLQKAVELRPGSTSYRYVLASAYISKNEFKTARDLLESLLRQQPGDPVLNYAMGAVLFLEVNLGEAEKYLRKSISSDPRQLVGYYYLGLVLGRKGQNDAAIRIFRDLLLRYPDHARTYEALGVSLLRERKYPEAQQALEKAILLDPNSVQAQYQLGMLLARLGQREESSKHFQIAQRLEAEEKKKTQVEVHILNPY